MANNGRWMLYRMGFPAECISNESSSKNAVFQRLTEWNEHTLIMIIIQFLSLIFN